ncbi:hypothetical protein RNZ50_23115 [Paracoccaceae bacterium Fryx2]|nr:hypothetical protein [Paracoccaceae bacterium Fryx2]
MTVVPHPNGALYSHKPPLLFWLVNPVCGVTGVSARAARLVGPAFGLAGVPLTALRQGFRPGPVAGDAMPRKLFPHGHRRRRNASPFATLLWVNARPAHTAGRIFLFAVSAQGD